MRSIGAVVHLISSNENSFELQEIKMETQSKIAQLEARIAEFQQIGLDAISRAEKWREALTTISKRTNETSIRIFAESALIEI
jgi:hypothetical protein